MDIEEEPQIASLFRVMSVPQVSMIRKDGSKEQAIGGMNEDSLKYWLGGLISNSQKNPKESEPDTALPDDLCEMEELPFHTSQESHIR